MAKRIKFGDEVVDPISGFKGTVVGRTEWMFGCTRLGVQPKVDTDGKLPPAEWFDEPQLQGCAPVQEKTATAPGGPRPAPSRRAEEQR